MARLEMQEAIDKGIGRAVRKADTLMKNTYYVAIRSDEYIFRVSKMAHSILVVYMMLLLFILIVFIVNTYD